MLGVMPIGASFGAQFPEQRGIQHAVCPLPVVSGNFGILGILGISGGALDDNEIVLNVVAHGRQ